MATQDTTLFMNQGADTSFMITLTNDDGSIKDLTGYTARSRFARNYASLTKYDFLASIGSPAESGTVVLRLFNEDTKNIKPGLYVFDLEILYNDTDETIIERVLEGVLEISPSVTQ